MGSALNLNQLRYFYAVGKTRNMKRAAIGMGVSQPALSKQIQALEQSLGLQLFYRSSRGMDPTPEGEMLLAHCERVFGHVRDLEEAIDGLRKGSAGRLAIAAVNSIGVHVLPTYLRRYRAMHPQVRLKVVASHSQAVAQALREHQVDVGLVAGTPDQASMEGMVARVFQSNQLRVVVSPKHPFAQAAEQGKRLEPDDLDGQPMIAFDPLAPTRTLIDAAFDDLGVEPRVVAESQDIEVIKRLVEIDIGFSVLPEHGVKRSLRSGVMVSVPIQRLELSRDLCLLYREASKLPPAVLHFIELLLEDSDEEP